MVNFVMYPLPQLKTKSLKEKPGESEVFFQPECSVGIDDPGFKEMPGDLLFQEQAV